MDNKIKDGSIDINIARSYNLFRLLERTYGNEIANKINNEYGYDGDITEQNAIDGINMLLRDVNKDIAYYSFKNGYSTLIHYLHNYLKSNNINIQLTTELIDVQKHNNFLYTISDLKIILKKE